MNGIVVETAHLTALIGEFWLLTPRRVRHTWALSWRFEVADNRHEAKLLGNSVKITSSRQNSQLISSWVSPEHD